MVKAQKQSKCFKGYFGNEKASEVAALLKSNDRLMGLTLGHFSLIDLIYEILKVIGKSDVLVATWSAGIKDMRTVEWMSKTKLLKSFRFIVDHSYVTRKKEYILEISELVGHENIFTSEIHAKFVLIKSESKKITIRTSMNLNANKTCESFEIDVCDEIFDFYMGFSEEVISKSVSGFIKESGVVNKNLKNSFLGLNKSKNNGSILSFRFK